MIALALVAQLGACGPSVDDKPTRQVTPRFVAGDIPCAPAAVLKNVCQHCHTNPLQHGAPFPFVTYSDTQAELDGHPLWYWMERVVSQDIMPLPPVEIGDDEKATLLAWLRAGAPPRAAGESCDGDAGVEDVAPDTAVPPDVVDVPVTPRLAPHVSAGPSGPSGGGDDAGDAESEGAPDGDDGASDVPDRTFDAALGDGAETW